MGKWQQTWILLSQKNDKPMENDGVITEKKDYDEVNETNEIK